MMMAVFITAKTIVMIENINKNDKKWTKSFYMMSKTVISVYHIQLYILHFYYGQI